MTIMYEVWSRDSSPLHWHSPEQYPENPWSLSARTNVFEEAMRQRMSIVFEGEDDALLKVYEDGKHIEDRIMYWKYTSEDGNHVEESWTYVNMTKQDKENLAWIWSVVHQFGPHTVKELVHTEIDYWIGVISVDQWCKYIHNLQFDLAHGQWLDRYSI